MRGPKTVTKDPSLKPANPRATGHDEIRCVTQIEDMVETDVGRFEPHIGKVRRKLTGIWEYIRSHWTVEAATNHKLLHRRYQFSPGSMTSVSPN